MNTSSIKQTPAVQPPFPSLLHFLNTYKPFSKCITIQELQNSTSLSFLIETEGFYYGEIKNKAKNGLGVYFHQQSAIFEGNWSNNVKKGFGFEKYSDGSSYEGNHLNGIREGNGKFYFANGAIYDGQWSKGERNGTGILTSKNGQSYVGEWKRGKMCGYGVIDGENGDKYEGMMKEGTKNGKGVFTFKNGNIYKGYFEQDQFNGFGELYYQNGNSYCGQFRKGKKQGPGELKLVTPKTKTYRGFFRDDFKQGYGVFKWSSGSCYKGFFERDTRNGYGEMFWADGNIYRGWWKDGYEHGKGELFVKGKGLMNGIFSNNILTVLIVFKSIQRDEYLQSFTEEVNQKYERTFGNKVKLQPLKLKKLHQKGTHDTKFLPGDQEYSRKTVMKVSKKRSKTLSYSVDYNLSAASNSNQNRSLLKQSESLQLPLVFSNRFGPKAKESESIKDSLLPILTTGSRYDNRSISSISQHQQKDKKLHSVLGIHQHFLSRVKAHEEGSNISTHRKVDSTFWKTKTKKDGSVYKSFRSKKFEEQKQSVCDKN